MTRRAQRRQAAERAAASIVDARNLVAELAGEHPAASIDPALAGVILTHGETIRRMVTMWMRQAMTFGGWSDVRRTQVFLTDHRLILRPLGGGLSSIYYGQMVGFEANLATGHVIFDFGDGALTALSGTSAAVLAVQGIRCIYGPQGLLSHPALDEIRNPDYLRTT